MNEYRSVHMHDLIHVLTENLRQNAISMSFRILTILVKIYIKIDEMGDIVYNNVH